MQFITRHLRWTITLGILLCLGLPLSAQIDGIAPPDTAEIVVPAMPLTTVNFPLTAHDFGAIKEGEVVTHRFTFQNTGTQPLRCTSVKPSCGCTTPDWTKEDIAPGAQGFVEVRFDSKAKMGIQKKSVTVYFENTEPQNFVLTFSGEVIPTETPHATPVEAPQRTPDPAPAAVDMNMDGVNDIDGSKVTPEIPVTEEAAHDAAAPKVVYATSAEPMPSTTVKFKEEIHDFGKIQEGEKVSYTFRFKNTGDKPLEVESVKPSCGCTTPEWSKETIMPGKKGFVSVEFDSKGKRGIQKKSVSVTFRNTDPRNIILNFTADVEE